MMRIFNLEELHSLNPTAKWNGLHFRAKGVLEKAARHTRPVVCQTDDPNNPGFFRGSQLLLSCSGKYFGICCAHQVSQAEARDASVVCWEDKKFISGARLFFPVAQEIDEDCDVMGIDYSHAVPSHCDADEFLSFERSYLVQDGDQIVSAFFCAYFTADQNLGWDEFGNSTGLHFRSRIVGLKPTGRTLAGNSLTSWKLTTPHPDSLDGCSGAPLFSIVLREGVLRVVLIGLIQRAGNGNVHVGRSRLVEMISEKA